MPNMAPNGETVLVSTHATRESFCKPRKLSVEGLQRAMSDLSFELSKEAGMVVDAKLPPISEVEEAKCECCGMSEECTPEYINRVRDKFCGRWICGLCSEAVKEECDKGGAKEEEALKAHMSACVRFNRIGRAYPVLYTADAMREILKKSNRSGVRGKSISPRDLGGTSTSNKRSIARSSSCIPAITKEMTEFAKRR